MQSSDEIWSAEPARLLAARNTDSGELRFPPFSSASPLASRHEKVALASTGRVYSFTTVHPNPKSGEPPFSLGYVDLPGPVRVFGRIAGEAPHIGATCRAVPDGKYGYVFELLAS